MRLTSPGSTLRPKRKSPPAVPSPEGKASAPSAHSPSRKFPVSAPTTPSRPPDSTRV
ncbi:MAG TPA: hypothetical protein VFB66_04915 [Tepidisphaeraceae bacterium]|nr:hypothetical protein [Tepidisphaeraceae bacterium]